jgi:phage-related protein
VPWLSTNIGTHISISPITSNWRKIWTKAKQVAKWQIMSIAVRILLVYLLEMFVDHLKRLLQVFVITYSPIDLFILLILQPLQYILAPIWPLLNPILAPVWNLFLALLTPLWNIILPLLTGLFNFIQPIFSFLYSVRFSIFWQQSSQLTDSGNYLFRRCSFSWIRSLTSWSR